MKRIFFFIFFGFWIFMGLYAQRLEIVGSGAQVRLFVNSEGLPIYSECPEHIPVNYSDSSPIILGSKQVTFPAKRFEISRSDRGVTKDAWATGYAYCKKRTENGGNWRLPNQKELFLIYVLSYAIKKVTDFPSLIEDNYMSGVVSNAETKNTTLVNLFNGNSSSPGEPDKIQLPSQGYSVRCVRDVFKY